MNKWTKRPWWPPGSLHTTICFQRSEKAFQRCRKSDSWKLFLNYLSHKEISQQAKASAALHYSRLTQWHFWHVSCFQIELDLVKLGEHKSEDRVACQTTGRRVTNRHAAVYMWRETPLTVCPKMLQCFGSESIIFADDEPRLLKVLEGERREWERFFSILPQKT